MWADLRLGNVTNLRTYGDGNLSLNRSVTLLNSLSFQYNVLLLKPCHICKSFPHNV